jgi:ketosteroid isomerase-like protein
VSASTEVDVTAEVVEEFNAAWNAHDLDAALALTSTDCVFESTSPAPDGERHVGHQALRLAWTPIFSDVSSHFTVEAAYVVGDRVVQQWRYDWDGGHIRGIDLIAVRDGLVAEKLAYVKG